MRYLALLPELLVVVGGLIALGGFARAQIARTLIPGLAFLFALAAFAIELWQGAALTTYAGDLFAQNRFALFGKLALLLALLLWIAASRVDAGFDDRLLPLGYLCALGGMVVASASVVPFLWVGLLLTLGGFALPFLAGVAQRREGRAVTAILGLLLSGIGLAALALAFHTWRLSQLTTAIPRSPLSLGGGLLAMVALGGVLVPLLGIAYAARGEEATLGESGRGRPRGEREPGLLALLCGPVLVTVLLAAVQVGAAAFPVGVLWGPLLAVLATAAALLGGLAGLAARSVRGLALWLALGQAGWVVGALAVHAQLGTAAALFGIGGLGLAGSVTPLLAGGLEGTRARLAGLGTRQPARAIGLSVALLSLAGAPPAAGFFTLFWAGLPLLRSALIWVFCAMLLGAGLGLWAVVRVLLLLWIEPEQEEHGHRLTRVGALGGLLGAALVLAYGVAAYPISNLAIQGAEALGLLH